MKQQYILAFALIAGAVCINTQARQPNILFIMSDDHDANTIGCYNSFIKDHCPTPRLDQMAKDGALFKNCFAINSLCAPSRSTIITGQYSHEHGVYTLREHLNVADFPSLPKVLQQGGYQTCVYGKWHLHGNNLLGFDDYAVSLSQGSYFNPGYGAPEGKRSFKGYAVDVAADETIKFIDKRDPSRPFFAMCHFKAAHGPWQYAERHKDLFKGITLPEPPTLHDDYQNRFAEGVAKNRAKIHNPEDLAMSQSLWQQKGKKGKGGNPNGNKDYSHLSDPKEIRSAAYQDLAKDYLRCIAAVDENVGKLIDHLAKIGELENTVIIYTGDQGFFMGEHGFFDKRLGLDEAMRMPLIIQYPKEIKPGTVVDEVVNNVDFAESMIDYANLPIPEEMSGYSFRKLLQDDKASWKREATIYYFYSSSTPRHYGVRTKDYKLLHYVGKKASDVIGSDLFDLKKAPNEMVSVFDDPEYAEVRKQMEKKLVDEMKSIKLSSNQLPGGSAVKTGAPPPAEGERKKKKSEEKKR
ncbi:Arylsulfatase [Pontiella desulfatans]|uniref:Arylsulfatase n=1 Tax=Pontiella desulfatans TaxID=2750659 RepID=A0A6C2U864_PONDE|nr:sulfatase [Pontiella desulfatans]SPS74026.1 sulfatase S1_11 [Kiritimatiellales bacterium]VGO16302.1 Arylsulfatase [Pontiella desulfatans]